MRYPVITVLFWVCSLSFTIFPAYGATPSGVSAAESRTELHKAVTDGDMGRVRTLLISGASADVVDAKRISPLHEAAALGLEDAARALLDAGASVSAADYRGRTPLHNAVEAGSLPILTMLLAAGAGLNAQDGDNQTPLTLAILYSGESGLRLEMIKALTTAGANPNLPCGPEGATALCYATAEPQAAKVVELLLAAGGDPNLKDRAGRGPLYMTAKHYQPEAMALLLAKGADPNVYERLGETPLLVAADLCNREMIALLLKAGADPNMPNLSTGDTALHHLPMKLHPEAVQLLLAAKADPNAVNFKGESVRDRFIAEAQIFHPESSQGKNFAKSQELLAEAGAKEQSAATKEAAASKVKAAAQETLAALEKSLAANPKGKDMQIPLYDELGRPMNLAAEEARAYPSVPDAEDEETVVISFFDPEQAREFDETVKDELAGYPSPYLTRAVIMDKSLDELAERIKKGAGVNVKDPMFGYPLSQAIEQRRSMDMIAFLLDNGANPNTDDKPLLHTLDDNGTAVLRLMLKAGGDPATEDSGGRPALVLSVQNGSLQAMQALLEAGTAVDAVDREGHTSLYYALKRHPQLVPALLEKGASPRLFPALLALSWETENIPLALTLLKKGATAKVEDRYGRNPVHWASEERNEELLAAVIKAGGDVNAQDRDGDTPLALAVRRDATVMVRLLLAAGASTKGSFGHAKRTMLDMTKNPAIKKMLEDAGAESGGQNALP